MDFYKVIQSRRTVREFRDEAVPQEALTRILDAGLQAPSHSHLREWEFVVLQEPQDKERALHHVEEWAKAQGENKNVLSPVSPAQKMYAYAMPRQHTMLFSAPYVVLPFFKAGPGVLRPTSVSSLNAFASIWCVIENIFLAAAAEGLACSMHIPVSDEGAAVAKAVNAPAGYMMPCYIGIGYAAEQVPALEQHSYHAEQKTHFGIW